MAASTNFALLAVVCFASVVDAFLGTPALSGLRPANRALSAQSSSALRMADHVKKSPAEAHELLKAEPGAVYLDVRGNDEFAKGHAAEAINIPAFVITAEGPMPMSTTFLKLVSMNLPDKDTKIVVGCQAGVRSNAAAQWLTGAGYTNVIDVEGGFSAWAAAGLPVESG